MEAKMKQISEGQCSKNEFIRQCLSEMKQIFILIQQSAQTLDAAVAEFFGNVSLSNSANVSTLKRNLSKCGKCGTMQSLKSVDRNGRTFRFLHCLRCNVELKAPRGTLTGIDKVCPLCSFQVLSVHNVETGKEHKV